MGARTAAKRRSSPASPAKRDRSAAAILSFVGVIGLGMAVVGGKDAIGRALPVSTGFYATIGLPVTPAGLMLSDIKTATTQDGGNAILTLEGHISNGKASQTTVPNLRIVVRDAKQDNIYSWTAAPPKASLAPGETVMFQSRLVAPPDSGHDLVVGFADAAWKLGSASEKESR